jgi:hypothetical protein
MSVYNVAFRGGMPIGSPGDGWLVPHFTAPVVLAVNGTLLFLPGVVFSIDPEARGGVMRYSRDFRVLAALASARSPLESARNRRTGRRWRSLPRKPPPEQAARTTRARIIGRPWPIPTSRVAQEQRQSGGQAGGRGRDPVGGARRGAEAGRGRVSSSAWARSTARSCRLTC